MLPSGNPSKRPRAKEGNTLFARIADPAAHKDGSEQNYYFTRAYRLKAVNKNFEEQEPYVGYRPGICPEDGETQEEYQQRVNRYTSDYQSHLEWEQQRLVSVYVKAIARSVAPTSVWIDLSAFDQSRFSLESGDVPAVLTRTLVHNLESESWINVTKEWTNLTEDVKEEIASAVEIIAKQASEEDARVLRADCIPNKNVWSAEVGFDKVKAAFLDLDLDLCDVQDDLDDCSDDDARVGVLLRWMDKESLDDEWKEDLSAALLARHL